MLGMKRGEEGAEQRAVGNLLPCGDEWGGCGGEMATIAIAATRAEHFVF